MLAPALIKHGGKLMKARAALGLSTKDRPRELQTLVVGTGGPQTGTKQSPVLLGVAVWAAETCFV